MQRVESNYENDSLFDSIEFKPFEKDNDQEQLIKKNE